MAPQAVWGLVQGVSVLAPPVQQALPGLPDPQALPAPRGSPARQEPQARWALQAPQVPPERLAPLAQVPLAQQVRPELRGRLALPGPPEQQAPLAQTARCPAPKVFRAFREFKDLSGQLGQTALCQGHRASKVLKGLQAPQGQRGQPAPLGPRAAEAAASCSAPRRSCQRRPTRPLLCLLVSEACLAATLTIRDARSLQGRPAPSTQRCSPMPRPQLLRPAPPQRCT